MTFILSPKRSDGAALILRNVQWRPLAKQIQARGLIEGSRAKTIDLHLCTEVTGAEAERLAAHFRSKQRDGSSDDTVEKVLRFLESDGVDGFEVC